MLLSENTITRRNAVSVKEKVLAAARSGDTLLDLSAVEAVDSSSVSILLSWVREHQAGGRKAQIRGVSEKMLSLMKLYGVEELLGGFLVA